MDSPLMASVIVTDCVERYVPADRESTGVAVIGRVIVYVPEATIDGEKLVAVANALIVVVDVSWMGAEYSVDPVVGVVPLVV